LPSSSFGGALVCTTTSGVTTGGGRVALSSLLAVVSCFALLFTVTPDLTAVTMSLSTSLSVVATRTLSSGLSVVTARTGPGAAVGLSLLSGVVSVLLSSSRGGVKFLRASMKSDVAGDIERSCSARNANACSTLRARACSTVKLYKRANINCQSGLNETTLR